MLSEGSYTKVVLNTGEILLASSNLRKMESQLNNPIFFRPHKTYIINLNYVKRFVKTEGGFIEMKNQTQIPIARTKKNSFLKLMSHLAEQE